MADHLDKRLVLRVEGPAGSGPAARRLVAVAHQDSGGDQPSQGRRAQVGLRVVGVEQDHGPTCDAVPHEVDELTLPSKEIVIECASETTERQGRPCRPAHVPRRAAMARSGPGRTNFSKPRLLEGCSCSGSSRGSWRVWVRMTTAPVDKGFSGGTLPSKMSAAEVPAGGNVNQSSHLPRTRQGAPVVQVGQQGSSPGPKFGAPRGSRRLGRRRAAPRSDVGRTLSSLGVRNVCMIRLPVRGPNTRIGSKGPLGVGGIDDDGGQGGRP